MARPAAPPVLAILSSQLQHQVRVARRRMTWWIPLIFAVGLCVSILGLIPSVVEFRRTGAPTWSLVAFGLFTALFGWGVLAWLLFPFRLGPRIVPYFARELGEYAGATMAAFRRGRGLYREIVSLEHLAAEVGVTPLSAFGFAYDHYDQAVRWHAASEGVRTVEALQRGLSPQHAAPDVIQDLEALASVLHAAAAKGVEFSLVLRLHAKDSMQMVCMREVRQGSFW